MGSFFYPDIPAGAYPKEVMLAGKDQNRFLMASAKTIQAIALLWAYLVRTFFLRPHFLNL